MNWTPEQLAERLAANPSLRVDRNPLIDAPKKVGKYRNVKTDGFDSKKEAERYQELKIMERAGAIEGLVCQHRYSLFVGETKICDYVADFVYTVADYGERVTEDCKGVRTPAYRLKKKLMKAIYGIDILET